MASAGGDDLPWSSYIRPARAAAVIARDPGGAEQSFVLAGNKVEIGTSIACVHDVRGPDGAQLIKGRGLYCARRRRGPLPIFEAA